MDPEILARVQFAFTIAYHYIYPPLSIGIGLMMVIYEGMFLKTKQKEYETLARFWTKIFGITFALGVSTGIVMEFELVQTGPDTPNLSGMCSEARLLPRDCLLSLLKAPSLES